MPRVTIYRQEKSDPEFLEDADGPFIVPKEQLERWERASLAWHTAALEMAALLEEHERKVWESTSGRCGRNDDPGESCDARAKLTP